LHLSRFYTNLKFFLRFIARQQRTARRLHSFTWAAFINSFGAYSSLLELPRLHRFLVKKNKYFLKRIVSLHKKCRSTSLCRMYFYFRRRFFYVSRKQVQTSSPFYFAFAKFRQLFLSKVLSSNNIRLQYPLRYKFFIRTLKLIPFTSLEQRKRRVKRYKFTQRLMYFRSFRRFIRHGADSGPVNYLLDAGNRNFLASKLYRSIAFYSLLRQNLVRNGLDLFFNSGLNSIMFQFNKKLRYIKRKLIISTHKLFFVNKFLLFQISILKMKRKPFSLIRMKRLGFIGQLQVQIQKCKIYGRIYQILIKVLLSFRLTC